MTAHPSCDHLGHATPTPSRSGTADLLKGAAVVLMIQVHLMELLARPDVLAGWAGRLSLLFGGPPVAPVLLLVMGYYLAASRRSTGRLVWRGVKLIGLGLLLNLGMNAHLLVKIWQGAIRLDPWPYILGVDILFLAGASTVILAVLRRFLRRTALLGVGGACVLALASPWVAKALATESGLRWALAYVGGGYEWSYFPWFPWLAYPLLGFACRQLRCQLPAALGESGGPSVADGRHGQPRSPDTLAGDGATDGQECPADRGSDGCPSRRWRIAAWGILFMCFSGVAATGSYAVAVCHDLPRYYHHGIQFFGWICAFAVVWVGLHHACESRWGDRPAVRWLKGLGRNVTLCYVVQWLIIGNVATACYKTESFLHWSLWVVAVVTATSLISAGVGSWQEEKGRRL